MAGEVATHFVFVVRGLVQIVRVSARGSETTLGLFGPGEGVGNRAALENIRYPAFAIAASKRVIVLRVPIATMAIAIANYPTMLASANQELIGKTKALLTKIDILSAGPVPARLALLLLHLAERFGDDLETAETVVPISLSRGSLARLIGAREETVIRVLSAWKNKGWVTSSPDGFLIFARHELENILSDGSSGSTDFPVDAPPKQNGDVGGQK